MGKRRGMKVKHNHHKLSKDDLRDNEFMSLLITGRCYRRIKVKPKQSNCKHTSLWMYDRFNNHIFRIEDIEGIQKSIQNGMIIYKKVLTT